MNRADVYVAINGERDYQDAMTASADRPDMVEIDFAGILLAMEECLHQARHRWYSGVAPHGASMDYVRKVVALGVKAGEQFGMPRRVPT